MNIRALVNRPFDFRRFNFPVRTRQQQNFAAVREKLGCAAFRRLDVCEFVAKDAVK